MTQEEKQLLLKDLCARLPYGVKVRHIVHTTDVDTIESVELFGPGWLEEFYAEEAEFFPYLRPMSSMTKEEAIEMYFTVDVNADDSRNVINCDVSKDKISFLLEHNGNYVGHRVLFFNDIYSLAQMDWLNKHHFDYRGLIPMGLALEVPKDMYKTE